MYQIQCKLCEEIYKSETESWFAGCATYEDKLRVLQSSYGSKYDYWKFEKVEGVFVFSMTHRDVVCDFCVQEGIHKGEIKLIGLTEDLFV